MEFNEAIDLIKRELSLEELSADEKGQYNLVLDDRLNVAIRPYKKKEIFFEGEVACFSDKSPLSEDQLKQMLQYNAVRLKFQHEVLTLDSENGTVFIYRTLPLSDLNASELLEIFETFLNNLEFWVNTVKKEDKIAQSTSPFLILP